jgi:hypothetical protein
MDVMMPTVTNHLRPVLIGTDLLAIFQGEGKLALRWDNTEGDCRPGRLSFMGRYL